MVYVSRHQASACFADGRRSGSIHQEISKLSPYLAMLHASVQAGSTSGQIIARVYKGSRGPAFIRTHRSIRNLQVPGQAQPAHRFEIAVADLDVLGRRVDVAEITLKRIVLEDR